jgi:LmbE family N-acetylglucosaminyl deacetylase
MVAAVSAAPLVTTVAPAPTETWPGLEWAGVTPAVPRRLVVVSPHPDDEVLGSAGVMAWALAGGSAVEIIAVTDGEGSHPGSSLVTPDELRRQRAVERSAALLLLGLDCVRIRQAGLPDGGVAMHASRLSDLLLDELDDTTTVVLPAQADRHPDHRATFLAGARAAQATGAAVWQVPIWSRVQRHVARRHLAVLHLGAELSARKRTAAALFVSQVRPFGPSPADGPVVHPEELAVLTSSTEWVALQP